MSEYNERNLKSDAPEAAGTVEDIAPEAQQSAPEEQQSAPEVPADDRENAPRGEQPTEAERKAAPKKGKKKRRKNHIALPLVAALVAVALVFGLAAGYGIGRSTVLDKLEDAEAQVALLNDALGAAADATGYDAFEEEISGENRAALSELSGDAFEAEDAASVLMSEDDLNSGATAQAGAEPVVVAEFEG